MGAAACLEAPLPLMAPCSTAAFSASGKGKLMTEESDNIPVRRRFFRWEFLIEEHREELPATWMVKARQIRSRGWNEVNSTHPTLSAALAWIAREGRPDD